MPNEPELSRQAAAAVTSSVNRDAPDPLRPSRRTPDSLVGSSDLLGSDKNTLAFAPDNNSRHLRPRAFWTMTDDNLKKEIWSSRKSTKTQAHSYGLLHILQPDRSNRSPISPWENKQGPVGWSILLEFVALYANVIISWILLL
jgi:hypothetical protein